MWQAPTLVRMGIRGIRGLLLVVGLAALAACGASVAQVNHAATATAAAANTAKAHKTICFLVQQAAWTGGVATAQLTAIVLGPVLTGYTTYTTDAHAAARLTAHTAKGCAWASLAPDAAWSCYDEAYLRSDYDPPVVALPPSVA